jgi:RHS repeat-associated protein
MMAAAAPTTPPQQGPPTDGRAGAASTPPGPPAIALPKGGGAIRGIGEKFAANPVTGTGSMSVPIATSPGRSGFGPQLALSYDSGAGNGPFGFGWSLSLPSITRKTDKGLPQYRDAEDSDVYILSGSEDLVPVYRQDPDGTWVASHPGYQRDADGFWVRDPSGRLVVHEDELDDYRVRRYRPRIEGLFARIERWSKIGAPGDVHWRSLSKDNILTLYGLDGDSRIADPLDASRVFTWLICETRDDKGNAVLYRYKAEDGLGVDLDRAHERNRGPEDDVRRTANRYLKRILYGNRAPLLDDAGFRPRFLDKAQIATQIADAGLMFEVVFDYGDHDGAAPKPNDDGTRDAAGSLEYPWKPRPDPFSSYRAGFEVRTTRLCRRVLVFHHFPGEPGVGRDCLVRSTDLTYSDEVDPTDVRNPVYAFLVKVTQTGYRRDDGGYDSRSLPPVELEYAEPTVQDAVEEVDPSSLENLPIGLDGGAYRWADLHGEGVSGILSEQAGAWYYKRNLSPIPHKLPDGGERLKAQFAPLETVALKPNVALRDGAELMDLAGDGQPDVVVMEGPSPGLYEHDGAEGWQPFRPFTSRLNRDLRDQNLKLVDLDGNGHADVLITEVDALIWHASLAEAGFGPARRLAQPLDEEEGPRVVFADGTQSVFLADISGDGLTDIVRIRNGEVCYWPNLGYGHFGARVTMDNAPWFDHPDLFDHKNIRLADIDGSGTTDIIYLHRDGVRLYFNQSGNGWSKPRQLSVFPRIDDAVSIVPIDLLGNGTTCLVWSSPLPGDARRPMRYVDLMGGRKPHLLIGVRNNLGAETRVEYAASTRYYLQDRAAGKPWITRLPFPVHTVERVETYDRISGNRFVTRSAYHHGYYDGVEREFRGFGVVEHCDTEEFGTVPDDATSSAATNLDEASFVPPVLTRTWFHTGVYVEGRRVSRQLEDGYYREGDVSLGEAGLTDEQLRAMLLDDTVLPDGLGAEETREACRALKGAVLRQEVYALDGTEAADRPYAVSERNYTIRRLQPLGPNQHAVFFAHPREAVELHYERKLFPVVPTDQEPPAAGQELRADPRVTHAFTLEEDDYGNVLRSATAAYGRRRPDPEPLLTAEDRAKQQQALITYTENRFTTPVLRDDAYRAPLPCETRTYELRNVPPPVEPAVQRATVGVTNLLRFRELAGGDGRHDFGYDDGAAGPDEEHPYRRLIAAASDGHHDLDYEDVEASGAVETHPYRRLVEHGRTLYRADDLSGPLALGVLESRALPSETLVLAFTAGLISDVYRREGEDLLPDADGVLRGAGYAAGDDYRTDGLFPAGDPDGGWWLPSARDFYAPGAGATAPTASQELGHALAHFFLPCRFRDPFGQATIVGYDPHDLLLVETRDPLGNAVQATYDYRVLQPRRVTDPNGNRAEAVYDVLGLVAGTAVTDRTESLGDSLALFAADLDLSAIRAFAADPRAVSPDLLRSATTRSVYDLDRFSRCGQPPFAASVARETHASDPPPPGGLRIQVTVTYSDGFGRELQRKIQAEAGDAPRRGPDVLLPGGDRRPGPLLVDGNGRPQPAPVTSRWVGSGRTVYNNKGKPVKQYEPFFSATHLYEPEPEMAMTGVTPILGYDPVGRVIATVHPNHTFEKVAFGPWRQETWDVNDTVLLADPRDDPDVGAFFRRLPAADYLPTWHALRTDPAHAQEAAQNWPDPQTRAAEASAAANAAAHAGTPAVAYVDPLGRTFLTLANNGGAGTYPTRVEYDIEGNQRAVIDARDHAVTRYAYDARGTRIREAYSDAGTRWLLDDAVGKRVRAWDSRGHVVRTEYDALRRPLRSFVRGVDPLDPGRDMLCERMVYGERHPNAEALNLRGREFMQLDGAGAITNVGVSTQTGHEEAYDFKGNLLRSTRQLARDYTEAIDWTAIEPALAIDGAGTLDPAAIRSALAPLLEAESFAAGTTYDALNRPAMLTAPDGSVVRPSYNDANLLERVDAKLRGADAVTPLVVDIDYNAKGQREQIVYGSGVRRRSTHDSLTFRLIRLETLRGAARLQDLSYTFDPVGNVTRVRDNAQPTVFYDNTQVNAQADYVYDAVYRLVEATGREHGGSGAADPPEGFPQLKPQYDSNDRTRRSKTHPNDKNALRRYTELYSYDGVGNILAVTHQPSGGATWIRGYQYATTNNRLLGTSLPGDPDGTYTAKYEYDPHGNMTRMPHLVLIESDHRDQLRMTQEQVVDGGTGERTYYVYDAAGQRVRKVTERQTGTRKDERIYVGGFEVYREYNGHAVWAKLERETLHVTDGQQRIALVETKTVDADGPPSTPTPLIRYQLGNHLGSALLELDESGEVISYEEYYPYGATAYQAGRSLAEVSQKRYRYTAKERDEETGFYYHGARYYACWLGRWTAADPIGIVDDINVYAYVHGRVSNAVDPDGRQSVFTYGRPVMGTPQPKTPADRTVVAESIGRTLGKEYGEALAMADEAMSFFHYEELKKRGRRGAEEAEKLASAIQADLEQIQNRLPNFEDPRLQQAAVKEFQRVTGESYEIARFKIAVRKFVLMSIAMAGAEALERGAIAVIRVGGRMVVAPVIPKINKGSGIGFSPPQVKGIGSAYGTFEEVESLVRAGKIRGTAHVLGVVVKNPAGKIVGQWYEVSELGVGTDTAKLLGHTEQKALIRIRQLGLQRGATVEFVGSLQPCNLPQGCSTAMTSFAEETGIDVRYRHVYGEEGRTIHEFGEHGRITQKERKGWTQ